MRILFVWAALAAALLVWRAPPAGAQIIEAVGTRAQGMAGAFVAVADDATASWWNPAGLATGAYFSAVLEQTSTIHPAKRSQAEPAWRASTSGFAMVFPALGLSYYRLRVSEIRALGPTGDRDASRQDQGARAVELRALALSQFGATVVHSVGDRLAIGSTARLVRGGAAAAGFAGAGDPLDSAADLDPAGETGGDLDIGAMASLGDTRLGIVMKHVNQPAFGNGDSTFVLSRQVRAGAAVVRRTGAVHVTAAVDADLTRTPTARGDVRHVAAGAEVWLFQRRLGVRGGVSANTAGEAATSASAGLSVGTRWGLHLNGAVTAGSDRSGNGWTIGLGVTF